MTLQSSFTVDDIRDVFATDLADYVRDTREHLTRLLQPGGAAESLEVPMRHAHSMKGVAAMVSAWGLSNLGEDLQRLYEVAGSLFRSEPKRARGIVELILMMLPQWEEMGRLTLKNRFKEALEIYHQVRRVTSGSYGEYLPNRDGSAEPVTDSEDLQTLKPKAAGRARFIAAPGLSVDAEEIEDLVLRPNREKAGAARSVSRPKFSVESESDNEPSEKVSPAGNAAGLARSVAKPKLLADEPEPAAPAVGEDVQTLRPAQKSAGVARALSKPALHVEEEPITTPAEQQPADQIAQAAPEANTTAELAAIFREEAAGYFEQLGVALGKLRAADHPELWPEVRRYCHTIKGTAAVVGFGALSERAKRCEDLAHAGEENPEERQTSALAKLIREVEETAKAAGLPFELVAPKADAVAKPSELAADAELAQAFVMDAQDQLERLETALLVWEKDAKSEESFQAAYRALHTLKGAANSIGLNKAGVQIHAAETLLDACNRGGITKRENVFSFLFDALDYLRSYSKALSSNPAAEWVQDWTPAVLGLISTAPVPTEASPAPAVAAPSAEESSKAAQEEAERELLRALALDAREQAATLEQAVLAWERQQSPEEQIGVAYRVFHTLKGTANSLGRKDLGASCHAVESLLDSLKTAGRVEADAATISFLLSTVDALQRFGDGLERNTATEWTADWQTAVKNLAEGLGGKTEQPITISTAADDVEVAAPVDYIRIDASRVRKLLNQVGEQVVERNRFSAKLDRAKQLKQLLAANRQRLLRLVETFQDQFEYSSNRSRSFGSGRGGISLLPGNELNSEFSELEFDRYDEYNMLSRQLTEVADDMGQVTVELERLVESFRVDEQRFATSSKVMQEDITSLTSQPMETLFRRLDRIFRDATQAEEKDATLAFRGARATLDRSVLERLYTPMLHLVRNAVAHGIEKPEVREAAGKSRKGTVTVAAEQSSNQVIITIHDDGGGVSPERVLARAKERGLVDAGVSEITKDKVLELLFSPGFSTASEVTSIAGRGVGLDVVKSEIESMNGSVAMETQVGAGTTWTLRLPLTLAISEAVIVNLSGQDYAIPLNFVTSGMLLNQGQILARDGRERYSIAGEELALIRLGRLFGEESDNPAPRGVLLSVGETRCVLMVDAVPARREIVVKSFDPLLAAHPFLDGATLDAEGRPVLILSAPALLKHAGAGTLAEAPKPKPALPPQAISGKRDSERVLALVVDDSLSVRTVQDRLLGDLGVDVALANDGMDALDKIRAQKPDIIFTDLEMPRMNGYDLISTVRLNPDWAGIPMVLVTSRAAQKHLDKARDLGCNGFLTKPFSKDDLTVQLTKHTHYGAARAQTL